VRKSVVGIVVNTDLIAGLVSIGLCRVWASEQQGKEWIERPNFTFALSSIDNVAHACTRLICTPFFSHHRIFFPFLVLSSIFFLLPDIFHRHQQTIDNHPSLSLFPLNRNDQLFSCS
jgi:hypothetical protein